MKITIETQSQDMRNPANSDTLEETEIFHLGKSFQNDCSLFIQTGKKSHETLWNSGACKCIILLESYQTVPNKYKNRIVSKQYQDQDSKWLNNTQ